jgi:predicted RNA polymerase sigma factor
MPAATGGPPGTESARRAVEAVWRIESARIVGALARYTGDFEPAEDVAQEAVAEALVTWSRDGAPANPVGWLLATARRRAIDSFRRRSALGERYAMLAGQLAEGEASSGAVTRRDRPDDLPWDPDRVGDDILALMFVACHPVLSPEARVALTLRAVGGLTSEEIARAFLSARADGPGTDHAGEKDDRRGGSAVRAAAVRATARAARRCPERAVRDLHGGLDGDGR